MYLQGISQGNYILIEVSFKNDTSSYVLGMHSGMKGLASSYGPPKPSYGPPKPMVPKPMVHNPNVGNPMYLI